MVSAPHSVQISLDGKARSQGKTAAAASRTSVSRRKCKVKISVGMIKSDHTKVTKT
jgi:hypothetical protein